MGPLSGVMDNEHCSVNFVDEPVEEFEVQRLDGKDSVDKQRVMNEAEELRASEAVYGKLPCEDSVKKTTNRRCDPTGAV